MTERNYMLVVGAYDDEAQARADFEDLKSTDDIEVLSSVFATRDEAGKVEVKGHDGRLMAAGTTVGAIVGVAIGLFAPPLLVLIGAAGAGVGAGAAELIKRHEEKKIGVDVEEWLPPGASAVIAVVDDVYQDRIDRVLERSMKRIRKAVDKGDFEAVAKAVSEGDRALFDTINA